MRSPYWSRMSSVSLFAAVRGRGTKVVRYLAIGMVFGLGAMGVSVMGPSSAGPQSGDVDLVPAAAGAGLPAALPILPVPQQSQAEVPLGDGTYLAAWEMKNGVKEFQLTAAPLQWETQPGRVKQGLAINGHIPAPTIRINEGDRVRFVVKNNMPEETALHWHGMELPNDQDGVPHLTQHPIEPGATFVYEWTAVSTGTHWYHSHMHGDQEGRGLYGSLEVVPLLGEIPSDRDYRILVGDGPLGFVFNGKSFPATTALTARVGERVRIRLIGTGPEMFHAIHVHSGYFEVVAQDGNRKAIPERMDTITLGVGQTYDLIWVPVRTGKWMIHCHIFSHSETPNGMTGMVTVANVEPPVVPLPDLPIITGSG
jgi:FtsP/CotA-like multicopper oxidase with cupredoxin domain